MISKGHVLSIRFSDDEIALVHRIAGNQPASPMARKLLLDLLRSIDATDLKNPTVVVGDAPVVRIHFATSNDSGAN